MAAPLSLVEQVEDEAVVVTLFTHEGEQTVVVDPADPRWPIAWHLREREQQLKEVEGELRTKRSQITKLNRKLTDAEAAERMSNPQREFILALFEEWRQRTKHRRSKLTPERFDMVAERLAEDYEELDLRMALEGLIAAAWTDEKGILHDDWKVAFKSGEQVERYANLCPPERRVELRDTLFEVEAVGA